MLPNTGNDGSWAVDTDDTGKYTKRQQDMLDRSLLEEMDSEDDWHYQRDADYWIDVKLRDDDSIDEGPRPRHHALCHRRQEHHRRREAPQLLRGLYQKRTAEAPFRLGHELWTS